MKNKQIYLSPPHMSENEKKLLVSAFESNWIAPLGPDVDKFEKEISKYLKVNDAAALSSGTSALHLAIKLAGVKSGDNVLCPSLTFSASANVILYENATPIFLDVDSDTWTLDINLLEASIKKFSPKALIAVDLYGHPANYNYILDICNKYDVIVIEDAAESLGSEYKGAKCGSFGSMGILSFNGNKIITTSGGGMLVSNDIDYIKKARFLSTQAREPVIHYEHKEIGYNYRMSNLLAAVGRGQLISLDKYVAKRRSIYKRYYEALSSQDGINFLSEANYCKSNCWLTTFTVDSRKTGFDRNKIIECLEKENIESRPVWKPMHLQPLYKDYIYLNIDKGIDISAHLFYEGICLPSGSNLQIKDQDRIVDIIFNLFKK